MKPTGTHPQRRLWPVRPLSLFLILALGCTAAAAQTAASHFAIIGDYGLAGQPEADVSRLVHGWNPDYVITLGDNNYWFGAAGTIDANVGQYYHDFIFPYKGRYGAGAASNRFWPTLGHHDWGNTAPNPTGDQTYLSYFALPNNGRYYDFVRGPVHFFALDSDQNEPDGNTSTSVQAQWLQGKLAAASEPWKVVYFHNAPYTSSSDPGDLSTNMRWPFKSWGASVVLCGKAHDYERLTIDGFPYIVNGLGGNNEIQPFGAPVPGSQVQYWADFGAMKADADANTLTLRFFTRTGLLIDTLSLSNNALAPTSLRAVPGNSQIGLAWTSSSAASYNVKRSNTAGGPYTAIANVTSASWVDSSVSNGVTYYYVVTGVSGGVESAPSNEASATASPAIRINSGGGQYLGVDGIYLTDSYYTSGYVASYSSRAIANTADPQLYLTVRASPTFSYAIPVPNGSYTMSLHFAECTFTGPGQRLQNVNVNGSPWLNRFDIFATAGGANTAVVVSEPVTVTNGMVKLDFTSQVSGVNAVVQAIDVVPAAGSITPPPAPAGLTAAAGSGQVALAWGSVPGAASYNVKRSTTKGGPYAAVATGVSAASYSDLTVAAGTTYYYVVTAVNTGGESPSSNEASAAVPANPAIRINCGGPQYTTAEGVYGADNYFLSGYPATYSAAITNTADPQLYLTVRASPTFSYAIPTPNGTYTVKLHFAECTFTGAKQRLMNITANGAAWLTGFDIYATAGGMNRAVIMSKTVTITNGQLRLDFNSQVSGVNAVCQAIEVVPQ